MYSTTQPLLTSFHPPSSLTKHLQCTCYLGSLLKIHPQTHPLNFDSVNLREPRNLHFNYSALRNNDLYLTNPLLGSEYLGSTFSMTPLPITSGRNFDYVHPCDIIIQFSICLGPLSYPYPDECVCVLLHRLS